jgi:glycosyltransferase involved in cell wall biosynthesis
MELSVICPAFNEIAFIETLVKQLCHDDGLQKEILIADGGSTDGTRESVLKLIEEYPALRLIDNTRRTSTHAFNVAFKSSTGKYIAFVGAHATYDVNYFVNGLNYLRNDECDVVGGPLKQEGKNDKAKAIALVMSSKLGVGNTEFRTENKKMYVDSVAFAIYKRDIIDRFGLMDESLPVNQDDEFHYRLKSKGCRILMVPEMSSIYFVRDSYLKLFKQYFRYGFYKPAVLKKVKSAIRFRHLIPLFFTLYILSLLIAFFNTIWLLPLLMYCLLIIFRSMSFNVALKIRFLSLPAFPVLHLAYGSGFLAGLFRMK